MLVLITGATGEVARGVLPYLEKDFDLRLLSLDAPGDDPRRIQADILDWDALTRAMNGADAVLHLAVAPGHSGTYEDDRFNDMRFDVNVKGTFHVFEVARRLRVKRVVHVSSIMAVWGHGLHKHSQAIKKLVPGNASPFPVGTYALTKALGEDIARHYAVSSEDKTRLQHAMEAIILRISRPFDPDDPELVRRSYRPQQIPFPDLAQAFTKALTVPLKKFEVVTIVGASSRPIWDLADAKRVLGYKPQYNLDDLRITFAEPFEVKQE